MAQLRYLHQVLGLTTGYGMPKGDVYFVSIDCEAYEHAQHKITEIGISVLPASVVQNVDAGTDGSGWRSSIQHLHLRPNEYTHLKNKAFIKGCPENFNFGTSKLLPLADVGKVLQRVFTSPSQFPLAAILPMALDPDLSPQIVLVGHALSNDTKYLSSLGCSLTNIVARVDTQKMLGKAMQPGLKKLLLALGIEAQFLHNAGNDAAYTLQAMLAVAVKEFREAGSVTRALQATKDAAAGSKKVRTWKEVRERERAEGDTTVAASVGSTELGSGPNIGKPGLTTNVLCAQQPPPLSSSLPARERSFATAASSSRGCPAALPNLGSYATSQMSDAPSTGERRRMRKLERRRERSAAKE